MNAGWRLGVPKLGLFGRIFLSTLIIYPLTRSIGFLLLALTGGPPPPPPPPPEVLARQLPLYAETALATLENSGQAALNRFLNVQERATGLNLRFAPAGPRGCPEAGPDATPPGGGPAGARVTGRDGTGYCLTVRSPRGPRHWHFLPPDLLLPLELACCALVSFFLARYLARPLRDLHRAALAFADGDLAARGQVPAEGRGDEVAALVRAFNRMADHISALIEAQRRFIADVSHEMKSPLARIGLAAALARRGAGEAAAQAPFDRLEREVEAASGLVRELQVLSSLEGSIGLRRREPVDLAGVLASAIDNVAFEWRDRPPGIRLAAPDAPVTVLGDPDLLRRAAENVLRNALFYTPQGTEVAVSVARTATAAHIAVRDHGPGVPEAALPHLFDPFYRVDESRARNTGGVGMGLAIFARAVALHGGRAWAENATPSGLLIGIELPLAPVVK